MVFPCLNPWGYEHNVRANEHGVDLNRQWRHAQSREISIIQRALRSRSFDLTICLHEDYDATGFYIYEVAREQPRFGRSVVKVVSRIMPIEKRCIIEGRHANRGLVIRSFRSIRRRRHWPERGKWRWNEYELRIAPFPGQTWWHCAFMTNFETDYWCHPSSVSRR